MTKHGGIPYNRENCGENGVAAVYIVGKIDLSIYKCVSDNITTDEVVITEERIAHIKKRHPNDYEQYNLYLQKIVEDPDYILQANRANTAFLLKSFDGDNEHFEMILRLKVSTDPSEYKNSVITFLKIEQKKWKKYLRNKKILYEKK